MIRLSTAFFATLFAVQFAVLFAALPGMHATSASAEEIQLGVAPSNPAKAGFSMLVLTERLGNEGFQPITLRFRAIGKSFNRQRQLRIQFRPRTQYTTELDFQFTCDVTVPQGAKTYDASILVPHFYRWETCSVRLIEDGRPLGKVASNLTIQQAVKDWGQYMSIGIIVPRDAATSGKPWAVFPENLQRDLLSALKTVLKPGGQFCTFAYLQGMILPAAQRFRKLLNEELSEVHISRIVWRNLPPAFVYRCVL